MFTRLCGALLALGLTGAAIAAEPQPAAADSDKPVALKPAAAEVLAGEFSAWLESVPRYRMAFTLRDDAGRPVSRATALVDQSQQPVRWRYSSTVPLTSQHDVAIDLVFDGASVYAYLDGKVAVRLQSPQATLMLEEQLAPLLLGAAAARPGPTSAPATGAPSGRVCLSCLAKSMAIRTDQPPRGALRGLQINYDLDKIKSAVATLAQAAQDANVRAGPVGAVREDAIWAPGSPALIALPLVQSVEATYWLRSDASLQQIDLAVNGRNGSLAVEEFQPQADDGATQTAFEHDFRKVTVWHNMTLPQALVRYAAEIRQ